MPQDNRDAVTPIIEDVLRGCATAAHARNLWTALVQSGAPSIQRLAECLLSVIQAGEGNTYITPLLKFVREWAARMPTNPVLEKEGAEDAASDLLVLLSGWTRQPAKHGRQRALELVVAILERLPSPEAELSKEAVDAVVAAARDHLGDKDDVARALAVAALWKLVDTSGEERLLDNPDIAAVLDLLTAESNERVRLAVVRYVHLDNEVLSQLLNYTRDRAVKVAAAVYDRLRTSVPSPEHLSPAQLHEVLWYGLRESRSDVRQAAVRLLEGWFTGTEGAGGDPEKLLESLGVQQDADLCTLCLAALAEAKAWDPQAFLLAAAENGRSPSDLARSLAAAAGQAPVDLPTRERAFLWAYAVRAVDREAVGKGRAAAKAVGAVAGEMQASTAAEKEELLERFLPAGHQLMELAVYVAEQGPQYRYVASLMLDIATVSTMNWVDGACRAAAEAALERLVRGFRAGEATCDPNTGSTAGFLPPVGLGGDGSWEQSLGRLAVVVAGGHAQGQGGEELVGMVLPWVAQLAGAQLPLTIDAAGVPMSEPVRLQALSYLTLLLAEAGPGVQPTFPASSGGQVAGPSEGVAGGCTLAQLVEHLTPPDLRAAAAGLAVAESTASSVRVKCAALRCHVLLCLRDGGQQHLTRAAAVLRAALYGTADGPTGQLLSPAPSQQHSARGKPRRDQQAKQSRNGCGAAGTGGDAVELQRQAVQGLVDLAVTWGVGLVDKALAAAVEAAARRRRVDAVAERLAAAGLEGVDVPGDGEQQERDGGSGEGFKARDAGVIRTLLRFTDGMVRVLQGSDGLVTAAPCGAAADAVLGCCRLLLVHGTQGTLQQRLRGAVQAMEDSQAVQLAVRLLLLRNCPAMEAAPQRLREQLTVALKQLAAFCGSRHPDSATYRAVLSTALPRAARLAVGLPPPASSPSTQRSAAPAVLELGAWLLASDAEAAMGAEGSGDADQAGQSHNGAEACARLAEAAEVVLEEVAALLGAGGGWLPLADPRAKAYVNELCKTPERLAVALSGATQPAVRRLVFLGRRAVRAATPHAGGLVADAVLGKLQDFVNSMEQLQRSGTAPLTNEEAEELLQAVLKQLGGLPKMVRVGATSGAAGAEGDDAVGGGQVADGGEEEDVVGPLPEMSSATMGAGRGGSSRRAASGATSGGPRARGNGATSGRRAARTSSVSASGAAANASGTSAGAGTGGVAKKVSRGRTSKVGGSKDAAPKAESKRSRRKKVDTDSEDDDDDDFVSGSGRRGSVVRGGSQEQEEVAYKAAEARAAGTGGEAVAGGRPRRGAAARASQRMAKAKDREAAVRRVVASESEEDEDDRPEADGRRRSGVRV